MVSDLSGLIASLALQLSLSYLNSLETRNPTMQDELQFLCMRLFSRRVRHRERVEHLSCSQCDRVRKETYSAPQMEQDGPKLCSLIRYIKIS